VWQEDQEEGNKEEACQEEGSEEEACQEESHKKEEEEVSLPELHPLDAMSGQQLRGITKK
jgi:hypothetical protein